MSVLLSAYYPEGIVFVADKNATIIHIASGKKHVEPTATKVLAWPLRKAVVGYVGLGRLSSLAMDDWMRVFIAETRDFKSIARLAQKLHNRIQKDFDRQYSARPNTTPILVIHLGGYAIRAGVPTPVMYHIWNHGGINPQTGAYLSATRDFKITEDIERDFKAQTRSGRYPKGVLGWLRSKASSGEYHWYNNGANLAAFNTFKGVLWHSLRALQKAGFAPNSGGLSQRIAFCKMAVDVFGSFFSHYYPPEERAVGGGVDVEYISWPQ